MSGRFRIDPRGPAPDRPVPPPPGPAAAGAKPAAPASTPSPLAPRPPASAMPKAPAAPAKRNRRALVIGAVVVALLLVGGGVAIYAATSLTYPDKYVLKEREYPSGIETAPMSRDELSELGMASNPGPMDVDKSDYADLFRFARLPEHARAHAQVLENSGGRIVIIALEYASEEDATQAAKQGRFLCSELDGSVLRDGDIIVGILSREGASRSSVVAVRDALKEKTSDLKTVCG